MLPHSDNDGPSPKIHGTSHLATMYITFFPHKEVLNLQVSENIPVGDRTNGMREGRAEDPLHSGPLNSLCFSLLLLPLLLCQTSKTTDWTPMWKLLETLPGTGILAAFALQ